MTNYLDRHDQDDTLDEAYARWLDDNGFPAMRELLTNQECDEVAVLKSVPTGKALGVFHAVSTRDGEARARDGRAFYALNPLDSQADKAIMEVQFGDGFWMLATHADLEVSSPQARAEVAATSNLESCIAHFGTRPTNSTNVARARARGMHHP